MIASDGQFALLALVVGLLSGSFLGFGFLTQRSSGKLLKSPKDIGDLVFDQRSAMVVPFSAFSVVVKMWGEADYAWFGSLR